MSDPLVCVCLRVHAFCSMIPVSRFLLELRCYAIEESKSSVDKLNDIQDHIVCVCVHVCVHVTHRHEGKVHHIVS